MEGKRVDSKLLLFTLVLVLITLLLLNFLLKGNSSNDIWNYKEITTVQNLIYMGEKVTDRQIYYDLEQIVINYLNSYVDTYMEDTKEDKLSYEDYYDYLRKDYKNYLSKDEYIEVAKKFLDKFFVKTGYEYEVREFMDTERVLTDVYKFEDNVYLCRLDSKYNNSYGYIAIQLKTTESSYNIVYIE